MESFIITRNKFHIRERRNISSCLGNCGKLWPEGMKDHQWLIKCMKTLDGIKYLSCSFADLGRLI